MLTQNNINTTGEKVLKQSKGMPSVSIVTLRDTPEVSYVYKRASDSFTPEAIIIAVAAAKISKLLLGDHAVDSDLVVDEGNKPVGILSLFITPHARQHHNGEGDSRPEDHPLLLSRTFGKQLAVAYCLEDDDAHIENLIKNSEGQLLRIDTDFSFIRFLSRKGYVLDSKMARVDGFELSDEILAQFPFDPDYKCTGLPKAWIGNDYLLHRAYQNLHPELQEEFIAGIREGFEIFKALTLKPQELSSSITPAFCKHKVLLAEFMAYLSQRIEAIQAANLDTIASRHSLVPLEVCRSISNASTAVGFGSPSTDPIADNRPAIIVSPLAIGLPSASPAPPEIQPSLGRGVTPQQALAAFHVITCTASGQLPATLQNP